MSPELARAPVRRAIARRTARRLQDPCFELRREHRGHLDQMSAVETGDPLLVISSDKVEARSRLRHGGDKPGSIEAKCGHAVPLGEDKRDIRRFGAIRYAIGLVALVASSALAQTMPNPGELARGLVFDHPPPFAANSVLIERLLSPRQRDRQLMALAANGKALAPFSLDLKAERFLVYVPKEQPQAGYGLLVLIPPWEDARLPPGWSRVLDREGMIFVTADRSGNDQSIMERRIPLALTATYALTERYRIDTTRIFVGGFSGGSRVALRTVIAFPDIFAGALLQSGSDPIGTPYNPLPSPELMSLLQTRTRFVFVGGENDEINISKDASSRMSLSAWCIARTRAISRPHLGHEIMDGNGLAEALDALDRRYPEESVDSVRCRSSMATKVEHARATAAALHAQPDSSGVQGQLDSLDREFGGLIDDKISFTPTQSK